MKQSDSHYDSRPGFAWARQDGFDLRWLDDGADYPSIWREFRAGRLNGRLLNEHPGRETTYKLDVDGRFFVLKHAPRDGRGSLWKNILSGPLYRRRFLLAWKAIGRGCRIIPRMYLLAERPAGFRRSSESYLLIEYLEGETLANVDSNVPRSWIIDLENALTELHRFGLASGNAHPGNLVRSLDGVKMIDLSFKFPMLVSQANDVVDSGRKFEASVPVRGLALKAAVALMRLKRRWQKWRKSLKKRLGRR